MARADVRTLQPEHTQLTCNFAGIVGFGAQILGMRVGLGLGLNYNRIVVGNPGHEASMVQSELKWRWAAPALFLACALTFEFRFGHSGKLTSPWGAGALLEYAAPSLHVLALNLESSHAASLISHGAGIAPAATFQMLWRASVHMLKRIFQTHQYPIF
jgi:hypothetical protein